MDPIPAFDAPVNYSANLTSDVAKIAPLATQYSGAQRGVAVAQFKPQPVGPPAGPSDLSALGAKLMSIGKESAHIVGGIGHWIGAQTVGMARGAAALPVDVARIGMDAYDTHSYSQQQSELSDKLDSINTQYKSGQITGSQYKNELNSWNKNNTKLSTELQGLQARLGHDGNAVADNGIKAVSALVTVFTAGIDAPAIAGVDDAATKAAATFLNSEADKGALDEATSAIGKLATNNAVFDDLPSTAQEAVGKSIANTLVNGASSLTANMSARSTTINLLLNYPLTYNMLSSTGAGVYKELENQKYGDALGQVALNAGFLLLGGPIGKALGEVVKGAKTAVFGSSSFLDTLSQGIGDGNPAGLYNAIKDDPELSKNFAALEATNVAATNGNSTSAAYRILDGLNNAGWGDVSQLSHSDFAEQVNNWATAQRTLTDHLVSKGMDANEAAKYVVGRWTIQDANNIGLQVAKGIDTEDRLGIWQNIKDANPSASYANNANLDKEITSIIQNGRNESDIQKSISSIDAQFAIKGVDKSVSDKLAKMGYVGIEPVNLEAPFKEGEAISTKFADRDNPNSFFMKTTQPLPVLGSISNMLTAAGLSPINAGNRVYELFNTHLAENLDSAGLSHLALGSDKDDAADFINKSLGDYARNLRGIKQPPVTDYRQFTVKEISKALGVTESDAAKVRDALHQSMLQVPLSVRGLGDRVMDLNYKFNPAASGYARIQGATRFSWNPFFRAKQSLKTEFLTQLESGGKFPSFGGTNTALRMVFPEKYSELDSIVKDMEEKGIYGGGYTQEATDDTAAGAKSLSESGAKGVLSTQKRSIAGLISVMADKAGMDTSDFVDAFPQTTKDTVQSMIHYDPRANFINSPMARTLNYAFFPFRFNLKVATAMTHFIQQKPLVVQLALAKGMFSAHNFLNSPEGQAWYSQNSDVISLFEYFSPVETLSSIASALGAKPGNVGAYGELGGLPFGWIPQLLDAEGLTHFAQPYVNPKSGAIYQDYVPISSRGKAQAAIEDFIGALFTYPGATVGLPSKTGIDVHIAEALVPGGSTSTNFKLVTPQVSAQQQGFSNTVQALNGGSSNGGSSIPVASPNTSWSGATQSQATTVPAQPTSINNPVSTKGSAYGSSSGKAKKLKKTQETPYLLPGQTSLGQIP